MSRQLQHIVPAGSRRQAAIRSQQPAAATAGGRGRRPAAAAAGGGGGRLPIAAMAAGSPPPPPPPPVRHKSGCRESCSIAAIAHRPCRKQAVRCRRLQPTAAGGCQPQQWSATGGGSGRLQAAAAVGCHARRPAVASVGVGRRPAAAAVRRRDWPSEAWAMALTGQGLWSLALQLP